jgi:hypothetical protein
MGRWWRAGAEALLLIMAALVAAGPVFVGLHYLAVEHYNCPDHHELSHLGAPPTPGFVPPLDQSVEALGGSGPRSGLPAHEHCGLQPFARHDAEPGPGDVSIATQARVFEAVPVDAAEPPPSLARLEVAPKQSPPRPSLA